MLRIIENMGHERADWELASMMGRHRYMKRFDVLTDDAVDELAARLVKSLRRQNKMNAENRRIAARRVA